MRKLHRLLMATLLLVPLAACDEGDDSVTPTPAVGTVTGTVAVEGEGLAGVTVSLAGASAQSTTTGANGGYTFSNVLEGNYSVTLSSVPSDVVFSQTTQTVSISTDGQTATADFNGEYVRTASILVSVTRGGEGVATQVHLAGEGVDQTLGTNQNGQVQFTGLRAGSYTVSLPDPPEGFEITEQTVQLNTGQSAQVNFTGERELVDPDVVIESITSGGVAVDPDSLMGRVEITANVRPNGNTLQSIELLARDVDTGDLYRICRQTFSTGAPLEQNEDDAVDVVCSWNTDAIRNVSGAHPSIRVFNETSGEFEEIAADENRPYHPVFLNGAWEIVARVTVEEFETPFNATVEATTINQDAVNLGVVADNSDWVDPVSGEPFPDFLVSTAQGLRWLSGDIHVTVFPIIYSAPFDQNNPVLQRAAFSFDGFVAGADAGFGGAELTAPNNTNNTFTFTFCEAGGTTATNGDPCYASIAGLNTGSIGARNISLVTKTQFGQFGPTLSNVKSVVLFDTDLQSGTGVLNDVLRVDNEGPEAGMLDETGLPHPANDATLGISGFSRTGIGTPGLNLGWVNWEDELSDVVADPASDNPFAYPALDRFGNPWPAGSEVAGLVATPIMGIGLPAGVPNLLYINGPDNTLGTVATIIAGADVMELSLTGADLPEETDSPGLLDAGSAPGTPFSDTELDYAMAAEHWDQFGNVRSADNYLLLGVDGKAPIFSDALGLTEEEPTNAADTVPVGGTRWDSYDDDQHVVQDLTAGGTEDVNYGQQLFVLGGKAPGAVMGHTTDRGNGFSGVAGVTVEDSEFGCDEGAGELVCFSTETSRWGYKLQAVAPGGSTVVMPFTFDGEGEVAIPAPGVDDFTSDLPEYPTEMDFHAYVATVDVPAAMDGYRNQFFTTWDRAGNPNTVAPVDENIADHDAPDVGNVQMPTVVTFNFTDSYTFNGEVFDQVDLKKTDFSFDFNGITTLQEYVDPVAGTGAAPAADVDGNAYAGQSLQLPMMNLDHTSFGSENIIRGTNLSASTNFLGCLLRFDEAGADVDVHRPRGPRWRSWDHSHAYGAVNTQFNTFVPTSVPTCSDAATIQTGLSPVIGAVGADPDGADNVVGTVDDEYGWLFLIINDRPTLVLKGTTATFVPNVDFNNVAMYYLDSAGRAILLDMGNSANWSLVVSDTGTGAFGRSYEYTYTGTLPEDLNEDVGTLTNGTNEGYFFVVKLDGSKAGHGLIWDGTITP